MPSDYAILHLHTIPPVGGDTLWASTYDIYDRLGERYAEFLEGLTGHYRVDAFHEAAKKNGFNLYQGERGSPKNTNVDVLAADHPLVRTNPVTGWKAVYAHTVKSIYGLTDDETKNLKQYLLQLVLENHDTVVSPARVTDNPSSRCRYASVGAQRIWRSGITVRPCMPLREHLILPVDAN